jgi:ACR3 family arsenite efflux pump ArsB
VVPEDERMRRVIEGMQSHQVVLYLLAITAGGVLGWAVPAVAAPLDHAITPVLAALLYVTFLAVPFARIARAAADVRFLVVVGLLNFVVVPIVVFGLSRFVAADSGLLLGVLLVLLTPCIDYVIVFAGLAGGDRERLLAATPLLMVAQFLLLPGYLWLMAGPAAAAAIDVRPFLEAFFGLIVVPLVLAVVSQSLAGRFAGLRRVVAGAMAAMVPLMTLTFVVVSASQVARVGAAFSAVIAVVPVFLAFALILTPLGALVARASGLERPARVAVTFSGVTRNSLVVLPLALAVPSELSLAPLVVVTQTLVELVVMVALVALFRARKRPERSAACLSP